MIVNLKGILLDAIKKEYDFNGKNGISYQLLIYCEGVLQKVKVSQETYIEYKNYINQDIELNCNLFVNGSYSLTFKG